VTERSESSRTERPRGASAQLAGGVRLSGRVAGAPHRPAELETAPGWLRVAAGWSWRIIVVVAAVALVFWSTSKVLLLFVAIFLAMVFTSVLRPVVNWLSRAMPRALATAISLLLGIAVVAGLFTYIGVSVATQWESLGKQFSDGVQTIRDYLTRSPLHLTITDADVDRWLKQGQDWIGSHSGTIASTAVSSAGSVAEVLTAIALAIFLTVFFLTRGVPMWTWFINQLPARMRPGWHVAGGVAWGTFSGYTRGIFLVAVSDGILAAIALLILHVPLAVPLAVLVFVGAFIPLIGAPLAMVIAMVVALAANGPLTALIVGLVIAGIGQIEGHVLQPLIMGKQVSLHPVAVAIAVAGGTLIAGILGAVIAVPLVAVAWSVFSRLRTVEPPTPQEELQALIDGEPDDGSGGSAGSDEDQDEDQDEAARRAAASDMQVDE